MTGSPTSRTGTGAASVTGVGGRCQLVVGHNGQHVLQRDGRRLAWPVGAEQIRPPWAPGGFPRDETAQSISRPGRRPRGR